jgi:hypothetical protein
MISAKKIENDNKKAVEEESKTDTNTRKSSRLRKK